MTIPTDSTSWEIDFEAEKEEIREAQTARLLAIAAGLEPFVWLISGEDSKWPHDALFPFEGKVRINN